MKRENVTNVSERQNNIKEIFLFVLKEIKKHGVSIISVNLGKCMIIHRIHSKERSHDLMLGKFIHTK